MESNPQRTGPLTILSIHAHPDDAEILAGGTLAQLRTDGHRVVIATMTAGDCGSADLNAEEISSVRRKEAQMAADLIGAEYICAGFCDLAIFSDDPSRRRIVELLRRVQPHIVITSAPADYLCDHEATSLLVRDACFAAPAPNYATGQTDPAPALKAIPHLYFMDPVGGVNRELQPVKPDFLIDVTLAFATKRAMLMAHKSQREWLRRQHGIDEYIAAMEEWTKRRGQMAGVEWAEGFRQYRGHPYPESPLLQQLLEPYLRNAR